jgi:phosphatidylinositol alpha-mannosyltransferase
MSKEELFYIVSSKIGLENMQNVKFFIENLTDSKKNSLFRDADLYVAPQTGGESFGIVLLEAMASNTLVLASDIPAFSDLLQCEKYGTLFKNKDSVDLSKKAIYLLTNESFCREKVSSALKYVCNFDWNVLTDKLLEVYCAGSGVTSSSQTSKV